MHSRPTALLLPILTTLFLGACGFSGPPERVTLSEACSVPDAELAPLRGGPFLRMEESQRTLLYLSKQDRYALLEMPGCRVTPLPDVPERRGLASMQILPNGARFFRTYATSKSGFSTWYASDATSPPLELPEVGTAGKSLSSVLSEDGRWIATVRTMRTAQETRNEIVLQEAGGKVQRTLWPAGVDWSWYELAAIDVTKEEIVLSRGLREYLWVDFRGKVIRGPVNTGNIQAQPTTFRWVGDGWFAWDAYRDKAPYGMQLSLPRRSFSRHFERLRRINNAGISPDARFTAASLETEYGRVLSLRDAIALLDTRSGEEIFRKYLPRFTRTSVAFLGNQYVAYGESGSVHVLTLPN